MSGDLTEANRVLGQIQKPDPDGPGCGIVQAGLSCRTSLVGCHKLAVEHTWINDWKHKTRRDGTRISVMGDSTTSTGVNPLGTDDR